MDMVDKDVNGTSIIEVLNSEISKRERMKDSLDKKIVELKTEIADIMDDLLSLKGTLKIFMEKPADEMKAEAPAERSCPYKSFADLISTWMRNEGINANEMGKLLGFNDMTIRNWRDNYSLPKQDCWKDLEQKIYDLSGCSIKKQEVEMAIEKSRQMPRAIRGGAR